MVGCTIAQRRPTQAAVLRRNFLYLKKLERASPPPGEMRENDAYQQARRGEARRGRKPCQAGGEERRGRGRAGRDRVHVAHMFDFFFLQRNGWDR